MLDSVIRYLHEASVPFRLTSRPSAERLPHLAYRAPEGGVRVETSILRVGGSSIIACYPMGTRVDHAALGSMLGSPVLAAGSAGLPDALRQAEGPVPPLGKLFGLPLVVDARVTSASVLVFHAFSENDFIEVSYEDFARLEQPRIGSFALAGELPRSGSAAHPR